MARQPNVSGDPNECNLGIDRLESEKSELDALYEGVCCVMVSEGA